MSKGVNKWIGIGNCCADPEVRYTGGGAAVATVTVACNDSYKDKQTGEKVDKTEFVRVVFFNRLAEVVGEYLKKGSQAYVEGRLQTRKWDDSDGNTRYTTEIVASEMQMLGGRANSSGDSPGQNPGAAAAANQQSGSGHADTRQQRPSAHPQDPPAGFDDFDDEIL